jgi:hypothetical protein
MPDWIFRANIEHFKKMLETEKDPGKQRVIEWELAEERAKLAELLKRQGVGKEGRQSRPTRASAWDTLW